MLSKTEGIVIRTIKYGESSAICNILTEQFGLVGFHIPSAFKNRGKVRISYLQPLNIVELSFNLNKNRNLQSISDITCIHYPDTSQFKQQAFYHVIGELLQQIIKENEINHSLFHYLKDEGVPGINGELHYWQLPFVMLNILYHYGCAPNIDTFDADSCLDLKNGVFARSSVTLKYMSDPVCSAIIYEMMTKGIRHLEENQALRSKIIGDLITYYRLHIHENFDLRSMEVMMKIAG